jgi:4-alpha-glucanotransferase
MNPPEDLKALARALGVHTHFVDGLHRAIEVGPETLLRVCVAAGAELDRVEGAAGALAAIEAERARPGLTPVIVAWDGRLPEIRLPGLAGGEVRLEDGASWEIPARDDRLHPGDPLPQGYHELNVRADGGPSRASVISAPIRAWSRPDVEHPRGWGVAVQLAALRSTRSRSVGDLTDLEALCEWVGDQGGDLVAALPLLPTFNRGAAEPSPYSPVSRLFWSELILDLGAAHRPTGAPPALDVRAADAEVRAALADRPVPDAVRGDPELLRYARFRGAQARLGRNWRDWPERARAGVLTDADVDPDEERFHLVAQSEVRRELARFRSRLDSGPVRLGLDLAVGVHPDGYDPWSRQELFADGMSVGAPPDRGFPSGQDWGFAPILPFASRAEGHRYIAASIAHQARLCGVLRIDHIMAWSRLYWIPHGMELREGTYVSYPAEELFAVLTLESVRNECEVVGEDLGTVPPEIREALPRHGIRGMYLAQFAAGDPEMPDPTHANVAMAGTHDTPTFAGWLDGVDIDERMRCLLLTPEAEPEEREGRAAAVHRLAHRVGADASTPREFLGAVLKWIGESEAPLVAAWLEDFWLETEGVNVPGTSSADRPNWQRPMARLLEDVLADPEVISMARILTEARSSRPG